MLCNVFQLLFNGGLTILSPVASSRRDFKNFPEHVTSISGTRRSRSMSSPWTWGLSFRYCSIFQLLFNGFLPYLVCSFISRNCFQHLPTLTSRSRSRQFIGLKCFMLTFPWSAIFWLLSCGFFLYLTYTIISRNSSKHEATFSKSRLRWVMGHDDNGS